MKTIAAFLFMLGFALGPGAQSASLNETLQKGLVEEETNRNLSNAISAYQDVLGQYDAHLQAAATAAFRLAECYAKLGRTNDAITLFRRVTTEFVGQTSLAALSRQRLADLGATGAPTVDRALLSPTDQRQLELLDQEVQLIQRQITSINNMIQVGRASTDDLIPPQRNMLELQRKMAEIEGRTRLDLLAGTPYKVTPPRLPREKTSEEREAEEIEQWKKNLAESPDLVNRNQGNPLLQAAARGQLKLVEFLLDHGADITLAPKEVTVLHVAIDSKNLEMVRLLLKKGASVDTGEAYARVRPLSLAAYEGWLDGAKVLLDAGASSNVRGAQNLTPLYFATLPGNLELVKLLLAKGAEVNCQDDSGTTPLLIAISKNFNRIADCLLEQNADVHILGAPLLSATIIEKAIKHDTLPSPTIDRYPPIFQALQNNSAMVEPLFKHGASLVQTNRNGDTVLDWLLSRNDLDAVKTYAQQFPREIRNRALLRVLRYRPSRVDDFDNAIKWLVDNGADVNGRGENGLSPLRYAIGYGKTDLAQYLLSHGADAKAGDDNGNTPIHMAAFKQNRELIDQLAQRGADINATNRLGLTPFDLCLMPGLLSLNDRRFSSVYPPIVPVDPATLDLLTRLGSKHSVTFEEKQKAVLSVTGPPGPFTPPPRAQPVQTGSPNGAVTRP